ncbi:mucoidy inhibitor MuiA family protein [Desulfothermus sp.]
MRLNKLIFMVCFFTLYGLMPFAYGESAGKITNIVLYPNIALVKKEINVDLKKGENQYRFKGFPMSMVDRSIQIEAVPGKFVEILDVKVEKNYSNDLQSNRIKELKHKIHILDREMSSILNKIKSIKTAIEFVKSTNPFSEKFKISTKEVENFSKYIIKSLESKYTMISKLDEKREDLIKKKKALENKINEISSYSNPSKDIYISLYSKKDINTKLKFMYLVRAAGWKYTYDIKVDSHEKSVAIYSYAIVRQSTGEDWNSVNMEISTSRPYAGQIPDLTPWYLDVYSPPIYKSVPMVKRSMKMEFAVSKDYSGERKLNRNSFLKENLTSFSFVLPKKVSIPSDKKEHRIYLFSKITKGDFIYFAVPKLNNYAQLNVQIKNPFKYPIMPGKVSVFLDGMFINKFFIKKGKLPGEELNLSMGIDESIRTTKKLIKKYTQYKGVVTKKIKLVYEYEIDVHNGKKRNIKLVVKDNIPVSRNEKIKVTLLSPKKDKATISRDGIIKWKIDLKPNEVRKLPIKFIVEYPKDIKISGL